MNTIETNADLGKQSLRILQFTNPVRPGREKTSDEIISQHEGDLTTSWFKNRFGYM